MVKYLHIDYKREILNSGLAIALIGAAFFILATALGAYVRIPIMGTPVPITLQTFFVMLSGAVLGRKLGSFSQACYFVLGAAGLPIFQGSSYGVSYILGPTGGYLIGFILAAIAIGYLLGSSENGIMKIFAAFIIGDLIIHVTGSLWLVYLYKFSFLNGLRIGLLPFVPGEIVKICVAVLIYSKIACRSKRVFSF